MPPTQSMAQCTDKECNELASTAKGNAWNNHNSKLSRASLFIWTFHIDVGNVPGLV